MNAAGPAVRNVTGDSMVLSVIAPCFNEQDNIDALADRMSAVFDRMEMAGELLLVDDGSTDDTWKRIVRGSATDVRIRGIRHGRNQGIEGAWCSGLSAARGDLVCLIDADLQNRPEDVPALYNTYLRELPDIVQGVRHPVSGARQRHLFSRGLNLLLNLVFGTRLRDSKSGFILCRREVLAKLLRHRFRYRYFQSFIGAAAGREGYTIVEVDTHFDRRTAGQSFLGRFPIGVSVRICWELLKFRVESWLPVGRPAGRASEWSVPSVLAEGVAGQV